MTNELKQAIELALQAGRATPDERHRILDALKNDVPVRDRLLTTRSAAEVLQVHPKTVFEYEKRGLIHAIRRSSRHIRWKASEVERLAMTGGAA